MRSRDEVPVVVQLVVLERDRLVSVTARRLYQASDNASAPASSIPVRRPFAATVWSAVRVSYRTASVSELER